MMAFDATTQVDDTALLADFARGDAAAAQALTARMTPIVYAHAMRMLNNSAAAEDVAQEALIRLWKLAPDWDADKARVTTWLYCVTANLCLDVLRKSKRDGGEVSEDLASDALPAPDVLQAKSRSEALQAALQALPDRQRQAVILRHIEELSNPEIAQIMDISVEAVESLSARGKRTLAKILTPQKTALGLTDG